MTDDKDASSDTKLHLAGSAAAAAAAERVADYTSGNQGTVSTLELLLGYRREKNSS